MHGTTSPGPSILNHLPPPTKFYVYQSLDQFKSVLSTEAERPQDRESRSQFLVFTHVPENTFERDLREPARDIPRYILEAYTKQDNLLIVKMPSGPHENAHGAIQTVINGKLHDMGHAEFGLYVRGSTTVNGRRRAKEPDLSYIPTRLPRGRSDKWPTLVLESGYTDSQGTLTGNAEWWLSESNGDTKIAMTLDIDTKSKRFTIKKFEYSSTGNVEEESVTVHQPYNSNIQIVGAPMTIPFRKLFLREPVGNEEDIVWNEDSLTYIAEAIWSAQKF